MRGGLGRRVWERRFWRGLGGAIRGGAVQKGRLGVVSIKGDWGGSCGGGGGAMWSVARYWMPRLCTSRQCSQSSMDFWWLGPASGRPHVGA